MSGGGNKEHTDDLVCSLQVVMRRGTDLMLDAHRGNEAAEAVLNGRVVELLFRTVSLVNGSVAQPQVLIERTQRHTLVSGAGEATERRGEDLVILAQSWPSSRFEAGRFAGR